LSEIRSYRRVFALERRIYAVERIRLNPSGVPVRGVAYTAALLVGSLILQRLPPLSLLGSRLPWYLSDLAAPFALGALLTVLRLDGRAFHLTLASILGQWLAPRRMVRFERTPRDKRAWRPQEIVILPDGAEPAPCKLLYVGPGQARIAVWHELCTSSRAVPGPRRRARLVCTVPATAEPAAARIVELGHAAVLEVRPAGPLR
jgi:hypothetical protein